ncbi:MAG: hypothetical protein ACI9UT_001546 [Flavobacteriales bacterium]|jgi:hypothetical protein
MFSHHIQTTIDINATPEAVWKELTNFSAYNDWNPMLKNVDTQLQLGAPVDFEVQVGKTKRMKLKAKMTQIDAPVELNWTGGNVLAVSGKHYFSIEKLSDTQVRLHHGEYYKGLLFPLMAKTLKRAAPLYDGMNAALKARLEGLI